MQFNKFEIKDLLRIDYSNQTLFEEACECTPNDTVSRRKIWDENPQLVLAVLCQCGSVLQDPVVLRVEPKHVDDIVELLFEGVRFQMRHMICPGSEETVSVGIHIAAQMSDTPGLRHDLRGLRVCVFLLRREHKLCNLEERFCLQNAQAHRALSDVIVTNDAYQYMRKWIIEKGVHWHD